MMRQTCQWNPPGLPGGAVSEAACEARRLVESNPTAVLNEAVVGIDAEPDEDEEN